MLQLSTFEKQLYCVGTVANIYLGQGGGREQANKCHINVFSKKILIFRIGLYRPLDNVCVFMSAFRFYKKIMT